RPRPARSVCARPPGSSPSTTGTSSAGRLPTSGFNSATPCRRCSPRPSPAVSCAHSTGVEAVSRRARTGTIAFKPRARLLKLIGEELISDDVVAVSELVKNAHDADAHTVTVSFRGVTGQDGEMEVRDDGCGMDLQTLLGRWMEPAASTKVGADRRLTASGRRVLGEKGVGRFAAD